MRSRNEILTEQVHGLIASTMEKEGVELVRLRISGSPGNGFLRVYIDKEGGVTVDDCTSVSRMIEDLLDMADLMGGRYVLEVSSPGLDRPLRTQRDFARSIGRVVRIVVSRPEENISLIGRVTGCDEGRVFLNCEGEDRTVKLSDVLDAKLELEF